MNLWHHIERQCVFPGTLLRHAPRTIAPSPWRPILLDTEVGPLEGWFLRAPGATASNPAPTVFFFHGNAELIDDWARPLLQYARANINVFLPEYRGYGRNPGHPSEESITGDHRRFYDLVSEFPEVDTQRFVFHGRSIGGGMACALLRHRQPAALILQSTFTSLTDTARRLGVPRALVRNRFDNLGALEGADIPTLILHGKRDGLVPVVHALRLHQRIARSELQLYDVGHNDLPMHPTDFWPRVISFARACGAPAVDRAPLPSHETIRA
ncbi:MAG: alpha/beta hydrolase [Myxococcales bacterium]|nr:alpha/beta hydrolase [Myxococcales bacterium]